MTVRIDGSLEGIDWAAAKADLAADDFDNGRSAGALRVSFERSQHVAGQHIGLQTDDAEAFYASLGYRLQPAFMSAISGTWLANDANEP